MTRIHRTVIVLALAVAIPACAANDPDVTPDAGEVARDAFSPMAVVNAAAGAGFTQLTNTPSEWGQGAEGYGRRMGSGFATHLLRVGIQYPLARLFHEEFGYRPSGKKGFRARFTYALLCAVWAHRTNSGQRTVSKSELGGAIGAGLLSRLWQPASTRAIWHGFVSAGITLAADAGGNVAREFWPEIRHRRGSAKPAQPAAAETPPAK